MYKMLAEKLGQPSDGRLVVDAYFAAAFVKARSSLCSSTVPTAGGGSLHFAQ